MGNSQQLAKMDESQPLPTKIKYLFGISCNLSFLIHRFSLNVIHCDMCVRGQGICNTTAQQMRAEFDAHQKGRCLLYGLK